MSFAQTRVAGLPAPSDPADGKIRFDRWLHAPLLRDQLPEPRPDIRVRRANLDDFDDVYRLVTRVFQSRRSRAAFDWLYLDNPRGPARTWLTEERATGRIVAATSAFPWPVACRSRAVDGALLGDGAVAPAWQRKGLMGHWTRFRRAHPGRRDETYLEWPNEKSRGAAAKHALSRAEHDAYPAPHGGRTGSVGTLPLATLPLDPGRMLRNRGVPAGLAAPCGAFLEIGLRAARRIAVRGASGLRIEGVRRFNTTFDEATARNDPAAEFWCPHDAVFLNWRYLDHPDHEYVAVAAARGDTLQGYGVVRLAGDVARLMELTAPPQPGAGAALLVAALIGHTHAAGCRRLDFFATRGWTHWPLLRRLGFLARRSDVWLGVYGPADCGPQQIDDWQCLPGDAENG